ncbi:MAG: hypothetical protein ABIA59_02175 [Candidatus Latescibacterota bacterium]
MAGLIEMINHAILMMRVRSVEAGYEADGPTLHLPNSPLRAMPHPGGTVIII